MLPTTAPAPKSIWTKEFWYVSVPSVCVESAGPPSVRARTRSRILTVDMNPSTSTTVMTGLSMGRVTERNVRQADAPSSAAASLSSLGTSWRPP